MIQKSTLIRAVIYLSVIMIPASLYAQKASVKDDPLLIVKKVADRVVKSGPPRFVFKTVASNPFVEYIDFKRTYGTRAEGIAYGLSSIYSDTDQLAEFELSHSNGIKIWVNEKLVYEKSGVHPFQVTYKEVEMSNVALILNEKFQVSLKKGANRILVKSESGENGWKFYLQSQKMWLEPGSPSRIHFSLQDIAPEMTNVQWLCIGPFPAKEVEGKLSGLDVVYPPEKEFVPGKLYQYNGDTFTWTSPRIETIVGLPKGSFYQWNYHVGGLMWALQKLSEASKDPSYAAFAKGYADFMVQQKPLFTYQIKELHAFLASNFQMVDRPMLDYSTAPSLPLMQRLINEKSFPLRDEYEAFVTPLMKYIAARQYRLGDGNLARQSPEPSVWVDDMFMGIPFLLFSAELSTQPAEKKKYYDDAARQVVLFNKNLFDKKLQLYHHGAFINQPDISFPFWSRANGWGLWATTEVLLRLPKNHPGYQNVLNIYRSHINGLVRVQDESGFWRNILTDPKTFKESSGTAIFTMAIARGINNGWLDRKKYEKHAIKGWNALTTVIESDGTLHGTIVGTNINKDPEAYAKRPVEDNDTHGTFPLIFTGIEMHKMMNK